VSADLCDICRLPLEGTRIGNGDGTGQRFAHPECFYRARAEAAEAREAALREALEELMAWQNGPPLFTYTEGWNTVMAKAREVLARGGKGDE
jgi:hypothetical protein